VSDQPHPETGRVFRFGVFEVDVRGVALRKDGLKVKLQDQPFEILIRLLERPGQLVTREELRERLWPADVFVDFDQGLNKAINKLREALNDSPESPRFVETVPRRGYRFVAPVEELGPPVSGGSEPGAKPVRLRRLWAASALLAALAALGLSLRTHLVPRALPPAGRIKLAVLPFQNLDSGPDQDYFSDGLTEEMTAQLSRLDPRRLAVIARTSAHYYRKTAKRAGEIGRELGVDYILEGSVRRDAARLRITAQLIQVSDETHLWAESYDRAAENVFAIQDEVARRVGRSLTLELLPGSRSSPRRAPTTSSAAHEAYLKGRYQWNKRTEEGLTDSVEHFQEAVREDPSYAPGHAGLADAYNLLASYGVHPSKEAVPRAKGAALRALELDPELAEAHASLGWALLVYDHDWEGAERAFSRAIEIDPDYPSAHQWLAYELRALGRHAEALAAARRAEQLDPRSLILRAILGWHYFLARDYDQAIAECRRTIEMEPGFPRVHSYLGWSFLQKGMYQEAIAELKKARDLFGDNPGRIAELGHAYAVAGRKTEARAVLRELTGLSRRRYLEPDLVALIHVGLGEREEAFRWLERAYEERAVKMVLLKVEPAFDPLRDDPRFADLLRRVGFPP